MPPAPGSTPGTPWTETVLYSFTGGKDGGDPAAGLVMGKNGALYGTTGYLNFGPALYGTVFGLAPPASPNGAWTETVLHTFSDMGGDGIYPTASLVVGKNGAIYGTTRLALEEHTTTFSTMAAE